MRVTLLRRLVGGKTLHKPALSLVYSTIEYCASVWCGSTHICLIHSVLNDALRIVTECLRPTPTDHLFIRLGIQPSDLRRLRATLSLAYRRSLELAHIQHGFLSGSSNVRQERLI